jgi:hypothetical protein
MQACKRMQVPGRPRTWYSGVARSSSSTCCLTACGTHLSLAHCADAYRTATNEPMLGRGADAARRRRIAAGSAAPARARA